MLLLEAKANTAHLLSAIWSRTMHTLALPCPTLIGRANDLATLHLLVDLAGKGQGGVALISGDAGIGKSRLIAEIRAYAASRNVLLVQGNCFPADLQEAKSSKNGSRRIPWVCCNNWALCPRQSRLVRGRARTRAKSIRRVCLRDKLPHGKCERKLFSR